MDRGESSGPTVSADDGMTAITVLRSRPGLPVTVLIDRGEEGWAIELSPGAAAFLAGTLAVEAGVQYDIDIPERR